MGIFDKIFGPPPTVQSLKNSRNAFALLTALKSDDITRRREAANALRDLPDAVVQVRDYLGYKTLSSVARSDPDANVREEATRALIAMVVREIATTTGEQKVVHIQTLIEWPHPDASAAVLPMLVDPDRNVRVAVLDVLRVNGVPCGAERVLPFLKEEDWVVRAAACRALGQFATAAESLAPLLKDQEETVRSAAAVALGKLHDVRARDALMELSQQKRWEQLASPDPTVMGMLVRKASETVARCISGTTEDPRSIARKLLSEMAPASFEDAVAELIAIYAANPDGFILSGSAPVTRLRQIGAWLNAEGGKPLMLHAHEQFARCAPRGGARNLEMMWDSIGDWRG